MSSLAILIPHSWGYGQSELCYGAEQNSGAVFAGLSSIALVGFHFVINTSPYRLINSSGIATALISPFPWWLQWAFPLGAMYTVSFQDFIHFLSCFSTTRERGHSSTPAEGRSVVWPIFLNGSRAVIPPGGNTYQLYANWLGQYGAWGCQEVLNCCSYTVWMCCTEMKRCLYFFLGKDNYTAAKRWRESLRGCMLSMSSNLTLSAWFSHCGYLYPRMGVSSSEQQKSFQSKSSCLGIGLS